MGSDWDIELEAQRVHDERYARLDEIKTLKERVAKLHGLVESACFGWRNSMPPPTPGESVSFSQDRTTIIDLLSRADAIAGKT